MHQRDFTKALRQNMTDAEQRLWNHDILQNTDAVLQAIWAAVDAASSSPDTSHTPSPPAPLPRGERGDST